METVRRVYKSLIMIKLDQDLFYFNFIYFNNFQINNNRKSITMKNFLKIVSVYEGAFFFQLSAHVWPIFDCYSNMTLVVYRIRDVIIRIELNLYLMIHSIVLKIENIWFSQALNIIRKPKKPLFSKRKRVITQEQ